jgi:hypothetical protein
MLVHNEEEIVFLGVGQYIISNWRGSIILVNIPINVHIFHVLEMIYIRYLGVSVAVAVF